MARIKNNPIMKEDFIDYLNTYSDFSFELRVLKMLRDNNVECSHGGHYDDPVTGKSREFDIRGTKIIDNRNVRMAIECKNIRENFPIIVSCIPRHEQESFHQIALVREPESDSYIPALNLHKSRSQVLSIISPHSLYKVNEPVGKSIAQIGRALDGSISANDSDLYEKWAQCLGSATDLIEAMYWDEEPDYLQRFWLSTLFPFVVIPNERLWMVYYDDEGNRYGDPIQTNRCSIFIDKEYEMGGGMATYFRLSHIEIVAYDGLQSFVRDYIATNEGMATIFPKEGIIDALDRTAGR